MGFEGKIIISFLDIQKAAFFDNCPSGLLNQSHVVLLNRRLIKMSKVIARNERQHFKLGDH